ncbi:hypothetical protein BGZ82_005610 [Podila clonocystis]|nr:hypothetical protein BGZ82_005610 [Podila clonocystis]
MNDTCIKKCKCLKEGIVCGYVFQQSCKLDPTMLYSCLGGGLDPEPLKTCTGACMATVNDHTCHDCTVTLAKVRAFFCTVASALTSVQNQDPYTKIFVGDLNARLENVRVRMSAADGKGDPKVLGDAAALGQLHMNATMNLINRVDNLLDLPANVVAKLGEFKTAMDDVALCSSANTSTCPEMDQWLDKTLQVAEVEGAMVKLKSSDANKSQAGLDSAADVLNRFLIEYKLSTTLSKNVGKTLDIIIQSGTDD